MKGYILVSKRGGKRQLYVPQANIQFYAYKNNQGKWDVLSFRTDRDVDVDIDESVSGIEFLKEHFHFTTELDVPGDLVWFAVGLERRRHASATDMLAILEEGAGIDDVSNLYEKMKKRAEEDLAHPHFGSEAKDRIGPKIDACIANAGGLR